MRLASEWGQRLQLDLLLKNALAYYWEEDIAQINKERVSGRRANVVIKAP